MSSKWSKLHICDDWISCKLDTRQGVQAAFQALNNASIWQEVVPGLDSIAVQFDPTQTGPDKAASEFQSQLENLDISVIDTGDIIRIPVCYEPEFAPDRDRVAKRIGVSPEQLGKWHTRLHFNVAILGFIPGFAYLLCDGDIPEIGRLAEPRQKIRAGSIGIIGDQSCIYSFDSPGGWPIIGCTPLKLFDPNREQPALLKPNDRLSFVSISAAQFEDIASGFSKWP